MNITNLTRDLLEEILSRVPVKSTRAVWSTCKTWNYLPKDVRFTKKFIGQAVAATKEREVLMVMWMDYEVYLMSFDLHGVHNDYNNVDQFIKHKAKLISLNDADHDHCISTVLHCDGLLLCITNDIKCRLMIWNPYCGQPRWIKPIAPQQLDGVRYALGYEQKINNSLRSHKVLILKYGVINGYHLIYGFEIYNMNSDSWKFVAFTMNRNIELYGLGVSVEGNTYWYARRKHLHDVTGFLICFDFTTEKFGPHLPLPFHSNVGDIVTLSSVREEQLAVLCYHQDTLTVEIWVTSKIEPKEVSWIKFFPADNMRPCSDYRFHIGTGSFFIDEKNKVVVVFSKHPMNISLNLAYIIGIKDGYFTRVDLGESNTYNKIFPHVCSYVPSSVLL